MTHNVLEYFSLEKLLSLGMEGGRKGKYEVHHI